MNIRPYIERLVSKRGSDLFITSDLRPTMKIHGQMVHLDDKPLTEKEAKHAILGLMDNGLADEFITTKEANFAYEIQGLGRFRISAYFHRSNCGMVIRHISDQIPPFDSLGLDSAIKPFIMGKRGLILVVGSTGHGKSTSLAAMLNYRNQNASGHIISIEDPIEFIHVHQKSIFTQREVGIDTDSYRVALKHALRQAPDVLCLSEIRDAETMKMALEFAQTGHLCLATLHANSANQALDRIIHLFPKAQQSQIWLELSLNLKAIIGQQLVPKANGQGRALALEVLVNAPVISNLIRKGEIESLKEYMSRKNQYGMRTFDQSLFELTTSGQVDYQEAIRHADSVNDLRLLVKLSKQTDSSKSGFMPMAMTPKEPPSLDL